MSSLPSEAFARTSPYGDGVCPECGDTVKRSTSHLRGVHHTVNDTITHRARDGWCVLPADVELILDKINPDAVVVLAGHWQDHVDRRVAMRPLKFTPAETLREALDFAGESPVARGFALARMHWIDRAQRWCVTTGLPWWVAVRAVQRLPGKQGAPVVPFDPREIAEWTNEPVDLVRGAALPRPWQGGVLV